MAIQTLIGARQCCMSVLRDLERIDAVLSGAVSRDEVTAIRSELIRLRAQLEQAQAVVDAR